MALVAILVGAMLPLSAVLGVDAESATAANASDFDPGNIMSDAVFYNSGTMSAPDIQLFLNQQEPSCAAGFTCLKSYAQATPAIPATADGCSAFSAQALLSAAQIIQMIAQSCGINPRVIVTILEKEEGLVTSTSPSDGRYRIAMGYGCPDTAACDLTYYGFFNQVYSASHQFKVYQHSPTSFRYRAGQVNTILWSPNACGSSQVYISSQATAGLYNYTPYRPNQAALNNLYGLGDVCSAYGNRNFWRLFTDWFGSTTVSSPLVRSVDSLQIWLLSNGTKYPINNPDVYFSYSRLGALATVTTGYLNSLPTGAEVGRFVGDSVGNLYFVDAGKRYHFDSYQRVGDYGFAATDWIKLPDALITSLTDAGQLTNAVQDASNNYWHVTNGTRLQAVDMAALVGSGETEPSTSLSATALDALPIGVPILRSDIIVQQAGTSNLWLNSGGVAQSVSADLYANSALHNSLDTLTLLAASTARLTVQGSLNGIVKAASGDSFLLTDVGKVDISSGTNLGFGASTVSPSVLTAISTAPQTISEPAFLRATGATTVYEVVGGKRHAISSMADYASLASVSANANVYNVPSASIAQIPLGADYVPPALVIRSATSPDAYVVDGDSRLIYVASYDTTSQLGLNAIARVLSDATVGSFPKVALPISRAVMCASKEYIGVDGSLRLLSSAGAVSYGLTTPTALDSTTCAALKISTAPLSTFVRDPSGAVYFMTAGTRRYVPSANVLSALGGSGSTVSDMSAASLAGFSLGLPLISADLSVSPSFVRADGTPTVYLLNNGTRSAIATWADYLYASRNATDSNVYVLPASVVSQIPLGQPYIHAGMLVRSTDSPKVYMVDGTSGLIYVGSFDPATAIGVTTVTNISSGALSAYSLQSGQLASTLVCGAQSYLGLGGNLYALSSDVVSQYGVPAAQTTVNASTCDGLPISGSEPGKFISGPDGSAYLMDMGIRHHVRSPAGFVALGGNWSTLVQVSQYTVNLFAAGSDVG